MPTYKFQGTLTGNAWGTVTAKNKKEAKSLLIDADWDDYEVGDQTLEPDLNTLEICDD